MKTTKLIEKRSIKAKVFLSKKTQQTFSPSFLEEAPDENWLKKQGTLPGFVPQD